MAACVRSNDVTETPDLRPALETATTDEITTVESIHTTKTIEEITDNSILISPTSSQSLPEFDSHDANISTSSVEDVDSSTNETLELNSASNEIDAGITDQPDQPEPALPEVTTTTWTSLSNCSNYAIHKNVVDLSISGGYRHVKHRDHNHRRHDNERPDLSDDHDGAELESRNRTLMDNDAAAAAVSQVVYSLDGDFSVSLITGRDDFGASLFTVDRINKLQLINDNGTLGNSRSSSGCITNSVCLLMRLRMIAGLRIVVVRNVTHAPQILREEVDYLKECLSHSVGESIKIKRSM